MVTSEATAFLREIAENVVEASIAAKLRERTLLGHHVEASTKSATTYDRDAAVRLQAKVHRMLTMIDSAELEPDSSRARKLEVLLRSGPSPSVKSKPAAEETSLKRKPMKCCTGRWQPTVSLFQNPLMLMCGGFIPLAESPMPSHQAIAKSSLVDVLSAAILQRSLMKTWMLTRPPFVHNAQPPGSSHRTKCRFPAMLMKRRHPLKKLAHEYAK